MYICKYTYFLYSFTSFKLIFIFLYESLFNVLITIFEIISNTKKTYIILLSYINYFETNNFNYLS